MLVLIFHRVPYLYQTLQRSSFPCSRYLSIYPSIIIYIYLSIYLYFYLSTYIFILISIYLFYTYARLCKGHLSYFQGICLSISFSIFLFIYLHIYLHMIRLTGSAKVVFSITIVSINFYFKFDIKINHIVGINKSHDKSIISFLSRNKYYFYRHFDVLLLYQYFIIKALILTNTYFSRLWECYNAGGYQRKL